MALFYNNANLTGGVDDDLMVGSGGGADTTISGGAGNDLVYGDFQSFLRQATTGTTFATAENITANANIWNTYENFDVLNATSVPHASAIIDADGDYHWYRLDMTAGQRLTVDIDYGDHYVGDAFNSRVTLYASDGTTEVRSNNDGFLSPADFGSNSSQDSRLEHTVATTGTYYVRIATSAGDAVPAGATFVANFSLTGQDVSANSQVAGDDVISGGAGNDVLHGMGGADQIAGGADEDMIFGGSGADSLNGGAGIDSIFGGSGGDNFYFDDGDDGDNINGDSGRDTLNLESTTAGWTVNLTTIGSAQQDGSDDVLRVRSIEVVNGTEMSDTLNGGDNKDTLNGGAGDDELSGGNSADRLDGGEGDDTMTGGAGNDKYFVDSDADVVVEAANGGKDRVNASVDYVLDAGVQVEVLASDGSGLTLAGNTLKQVIFGDAGANQLWGGGGVADKLVGKGGNDTYFISNSNDTIREKAGQGSADTVVTEVDFNIKDLWRVEVMQAQGGAGAIDLTGNKHDNILEGNGGANVLFGKNGNDTLTGNGGADTFLFKEFPTDNNADVITDMTVGTDTIHLESNKFRGIGEGAISANELVINTTGEAEAAANRLIYNSDSGELFYDRDGTGARTPKLIATMDADLALTTSDFLIV